MLVLVCGVLAVLSPLMFGGDLRRLSLVRLRAVWLPVLALLAQIVIIEVVPDASPVVLEGVHLATYVAAGVFVAVNWRIPGLLLIALGGALNGITIALNDGTLPASADALRAAGFPVEDSDFVNSGVLSHPVLPVLGDIFAWPTPLPLANVFSIGDVVIVLGAAYGAHRISGSRLVKHPWSPVEVERETADVPVVAEAAVTPPTPTSAGVGSSGAVHLGFAPGPVPGAAVSPLQQRLAALRAQDGPAQRPGLRH
jgi:hypothetical protein